MKLIIRRSLLLYFGLPCTRLRYLRLGLNKITKVVYILVTAALFPDIYHTRDTLVASREETKENQVSINPPSNESGPLTHSLFPNRNHGQPLIIKFGLYIIHTHTHIYTGPKPNRRQNQTKKIAARSQWNGRQLQRRKRPFRRISARGARSHADLLPTLCRLEIASATFVHRFSFLFF